MNPGLLRIAGMDEATPLPRAFYEREADVVARDLLGCLLVRRHPGGIQAGRIVETEAYLGPHDKASHSSKGCTARNRSMFGQPGHAYVYQIYGIHFCLNAVTGPEGHGAAVLFRGLDPVSGIEGRTHGPGLLCRALELDRSWDGEDLLGDRLFVVGCHDAARPRHIVRQRRVGVDYAGSWARRLLRFRTP
jgi:DNA-3-methyladenine glycosylase